MDMILLDWTRMGRSYCLAGAVAEKGYWRIIRPLQSRYRAAAVRNVGWSPYLLDGHSRWEVFELIGPEPAGGPAPHLEDFWVRTLRPRRRLASPQQRRAILEATTAPTGQPLFGAPLVPTSAAAYLEPGTGQRSLATITAPAADLHFSACQRQGLAEPDIRLSVPLPGVGPRRLPVKDHHLLARVEALSTDLAVREQLLDQAVRQMGQQVAVRLGLSRSYQPGDQRTPAQCWLMVDGIFSLADPQP